MVRFISFFAMGLFLIIGCGKNNDTNTTVQEGTCKGPIIVHVSDGQPKSEPIYSWDNGLVTAADIIAVARTSNLSTPVWEIQSAPPQTNKIQSPWQQGTTSGSVSTIANTEVTLQSQIEYRVTITDQDGVTSGYCNFTITQ